MLKSITLKRFKSICNDNPIPLDSYSILCGSNSSGKSSLIQAILFLSQSFSSRHDKTSFVLNGALTKLGSINDIRSHFTNEKSVEIRITLSNVNFRWQLLPSDTIELRLLLAKRNSFDGSLDDDLHPVVIESDIILTSQRDGQPFVQTLSVFDENFNKLQNLDIIERGALFKIKNFKIDDIENLSQEYPDLSMKGFIRDGFVPKTLVFEYDKTKRIANRVIQTICGTNTHFTTVLGGHYLEFDDNKIRLPASFIEKIKELISIERKSLNESFELPEALRKAMRANHALQRSVDLEEVKKQLISQKFPISENLFDNPTFKESISIKQFKSFLASLPKEISSSLHELLKKNNEALKVAWYNGTPKELGFESKTLPVFDAIEDYLVSYFSRSVKYLGPLRIEPQANYPSTGLADPKNVGLKGENTAAVLHVNRGRHIRYSSPSEDEDGRLTLSESATPLYIACKTWLTYLGVANDFQTVDTGKMGHLLRIKTNNADQWQDLTHVGVGVSQVLPIILMALLSDPGDMLIFEQPELHLHPRVQSRLCDFFIAVALSGRQCLVETHSEYMITRLRTRIAQSENEDIKNLSSIYFVDKINGSSHFSKVDISRFGAIENWPKDFFDDNNKEVEMIIREAAQKRKKERAKLQQSRMNDRE